MESQDEKLQQHGLEASNFHCVLPDLQTPNINLLIGVPEVHEREGGGAPEELTMMPKCTTKNIDQ